MNKPTAKDWVAMFERLRQYYGSETPMGELRSYIERHVKKIEQRVLFKSTLTKYLYDITKLNLWNKKSLENPQH